MYQSPIAASDQPPTGEFQQFATQTPPMAETAPLSVESVPQYDQYTQTTADRQQAERLAQAAMGQSSGETAQVPMSAEVAAHAAKEMAQEAGLYHAPAQPENGSGLYTPRPEELRYDNENARLEISTAGPAVVAVRLGKLAELGNASDYALAGSN